MWVEYLPWSLDKGDFRLGVLTHYKATHEEAVITRPDCGGTEHWVKFKNVYPMYDLPRAWNPSGKPASEPDALLDLASNEDAENEREENTDE